MSWMAKACLFAGGMFALAALAWMAFLPALVERQLRALTGFDVHVADLTANPFTGRVFVRGLAARNPPHYPKPDFVELREVRADLDEFSWVFTGKFVVDELDVDAGKIELVLQSNGKSNAGEFMAAFSRGGLPAAPGPAPAAEPSKPFRYLVKKLHVRLGRLVVADYSGLISEEKTYDMNIDETYNNVSDPRQLLVPSVVRSLYQFGLHRDVSKLLPGEFGKALADAVGSAAAAGTKIKDAGKKAGDYFKGLFDKLEQSGKP